jgi:hypothetical protein
MKFILIKQIERIMKQNSIDCLINFNNNVLISDIKKYRKCIPVTHDKELTYE